MINKEDFNKEQVIREVMPIGNGAHVFVLKEWIGEKLVLIRTPELSLKNKILKIIEPYLEDILGVYLYGSYARKEQRNDSDIDILIISNKSFSIKEKGFEVVVLEKDRIGDAIKIAPILIYSALNEAKTIINSVLLQEIKRRYIPKPSDFKEYIKETKNIIKINEELLDPYSIILRLRGVYLVEKLLSNETASNRDFKRWTAKNIKRNDLENGDFKNAYYFYTKIKKEEKTKVKGENLKPLLVMLKIKVLELEEKINEKGKEA